jgi:hypothetical protein
MFHKRLQWKDELMLQTLFIYISDFIHTIHRTQIQFQFSVPASTSVLSRLFSSSFASQFTYIKSNFKVLKQSQKGAVGKRILDADLNVKFRNVHVWSMWNQFKVSNYVPLIIRQSELFSWWDLELLSMMRVLMFTSYVRSSPREVQHII